MLHIKGNETYSNIQAFILPLHIHTFDPWDGVKRSKHFLEGGQVAYQIKGNEAKSDITHTLTSRVGLKSV